MVWLVFVVGILKTWRSHTVLCVAPISGLCLYNRAGFSRYWSRYGDLRLVVWEREGVRRISGNPRQSGWGGLGDLQAKWSRIVQGVSGVGGVF